MNLIYVVDPMCSWCYGFARPMDALLAEPGEFAPLQLALVMGGLRPFTTQPTPPERADELAGHWKRVAEASGQPFKQAPDTALHKPGFIYDTEPAARAVVTVRTHWPKVVWRYLKAVQHAFYAEGRDIVQPEVLAAVADGLGIPRTEFAPHFASQAMRDAVKADFALAQQWGLRGFPALVAEHGDHLHLVAQGYVPIDTLRQQLAAATAAHG
jgi:putative protein-disulfide isomerase